MDRLKSTIARLAPVGRLKDLSLYALSGIYNKAIMVALLPVLTAYLDPAGYGVVATFMATVGLLVRMVSGGSNAMITKDYPGLEGGQLGRYMGDVLTVVLILSCCVLAASAAAVSFSDQWIARLIGGGEGLLLLAVAVAGANAITIVLLTLFTQREEAANYLALSSGQRTAELALAIGLIVLAGARWRGWLTGIVVGALGACGYTLFYLIRRRLVKIQLKRLYERVSRLLRLGLPLVPNAMGVWALNVADRLIITGMQGSQATGVYSVAYAFGTGVMILQAAAGRVWAPFFFRNIRKETADARVRIKRFTFVYILGVVAVVVAVAVLGPIVLPLFVDDAYLGGRMIIPIVAAAYGANSMYRIFSQYLIHREATALLGGIVMAEALLNVGLNIWLIGRLGIFGAALATAISFAAGALVVTAVAVRLHPMNWLSKETMLAIRTSLADQEDRG